MKIQLIISLVIAYISISGQDLTTELLQRDGESTIDDIMNNSIQDKEQLIENTILENDELEEEDEEIECADEAEITENNNLRNSKKPELPPFDPNTCKLPTAIKSEIKGYQGIVTQIVQETIKGSFKTKAYNDLATFVDKFGPRSSGSNALERALDYLKGQLQDQGLENVHEEPVEIPKWSRAYESAELLEPWPYKVASIARYYSIGTPPGGVTAELVVILKNRELKDNPEKVKGKIVLCYHLCSSSKLKELGALVNVLAFHSTWGFQVFHRLGGVSLKKPVADIPITYINGADKDMFVRMAQAGTKMVMKYELRVSPRALLNSRNIIGDYPGSSKRQEIVSVSGHTDNWDVAHGVQDDGFGVIIALETVKLYKSLNLIPKRTIRVMFWTTEELGEWGSRSYVAKHGSELTNWQTQVEADSGCFSPTLLCYNGHPEFGCIVYEIYKLIYANFESTLNPSILPNSTIAFREHWSSDSDKFREKGVPTLGLSNPGSVYGRIYHTPADTMLKIKPGDLDICSAIISAAVYVLADIDMKIPRIDPEGNYS